MSDKIPSSITILMLADAGFPPTDDQRKYLKLIRFIKRFINENGSHTNLTYEAKELLKNMGEIE